MFVIGNDLPPTTIEFGRISGEITEIWKRVGLELGLKPHKLNTIELEHVNSKRNASLDMLFTWRDANINVSRRVLNQATERAMKRCQANGGMYLLFFNHVHGVASLQCKKLLAKKGLYVKVVKLKISTKNTLVK